MKFGHRVVPERDRAASGRMGRTLPLPLMALVVFLCAGCSRTPDAAPVPPGPPMPPAQAAASRAAVINNDSRLTPLQKQQALQRLGAQSQPGPPTAP